MMADSELYIHIIWIQYTGKVHTQTRFHNLVYSTMACEPQSYMQVRLPIGKKLVTKITEPKRQHFK
jgi:hypothetical protein